MYGHGTTDPPEFQSIHESGLYSLQDHDVELADVALSSPLERYPLPSSPTVNGGSMVGLLPRWVSRESAVGVLFFPVCLFVYVYYSVVLLLLL